MTMRRCGMSNRATSHIATRWGARHLPGWPAPPTRQLAEVVAKYVTVDMFAKACAGASTKEVIKNAEAQLKEIYRTT